MARERERGFYLDCTECTEMGGDIESIDIYSEMEGEFKSELA